MYIVLDGQCKMAITDCNDWYLTTTLAVLQLYRGVKFFFINLRQLQDP